MNSTDRNKDDFFMKQAIAQAKKAANKDEVPIGAVLVSEDKNIIVRGYNQVEQKQSQQAHAEMVVLKKASSKMKSWRLDKFTLYVTVQPCMMCLGALYLSRISRIVYGVSSPKFGMSIEDIVKSSIYKNIEMKVEHIQSDAAKDILQQFFKKKRRV